MNIYTNELGHMTKMAAMPVYGKKNPLSIFFSRTNGQMDLELGILHQVPDYYQDCSKNDLGLTLTFLGQRQISENASA